MEKFRINNDLSIFWSITEKDGSPYTLSDKTVRLFVTSPRGRMDVTSDITVQDNVICWLFRGSRQRYLGTYKITVEIQASPADRTIRKDIPEAFELVSSTQYEQTEIGRPDINEEGELTLATSLDIFQIKPIIPQVGPNRNWWVDGADTGKSSVGLTAYEFAKEQGYEGTVEEYEMECLSVPYYNELSRIATAESEQATQQSIAQQEEVSIYMKDVAEPTIARAQQAAAKAEQAITSIPKKTSQLVNDSGFITKEGVPASDWNASTYKEGHIKNRTHHMQDYMCHYFKGSPIKVSKPNGTGYVLLTYDTDLADKFIRIEIKADESKTYEFLDAMGMPLIFTWDADGSTINVQSFGGAVESYGMRAYYSSSATGYDDYFIALDEGFIPKTIARKQDIADQLAELSEENAQLRERIAEQDILIEDLQNTKIDRENDDYYPKMAVGTADNLAGVDEVDSEFTFRQSGGGAITDGVARVQSIKGNSVVWNQIFRPSINAYGSQYCALDADGITMEAIKTPNEKFLSISRKLVGKANHKYAVNFLVVSGSYSTDDTHIEAWGKIVKPTETLLILLSSDYNEAVAIRLVGCIGMKFRVLIYDLTQMFGSGNEPTTTEEFYARIPMGVDLNAYNEGEIIDMRAEGIKSVGVNQWDEQWRNDGDYNSTGEWVSLAVISSMNAIKVKPNAQYYVTSVNNQTIYLTYWNGSQFISRSANVANSIVTIPSNCNLVHLSCNTNYGTTYNHDICINLSNADINGKYFPYEEASEDLSLVAKYFPDGMRSAGAAHDEIRYNKQTNKWEAVQRIGMANLWEQNLSPYEPVTGIKAFSLLLSKLVNAKEGFLSSEKANVLCSLYKTEKWNDLYYGTITVGIASSGTWFRLCDTAYEDVASLKAMLQEKQVVLYYELAEPIVTEIEEKDFNLDYSVWNCGTEQMVATEPSAPLAADITYGFNAVGLLKQIKAALQAAGLM